MRYIHLQHEVVHAQYDAAAGKWHVRVRRPNAKTGAMEEIEDSGDVLVTAIGVLSRWKWPDIEGLKNFKGELHHSAGFEPAPKTWEELAETWADKKVGVIGVVCIPCVRRDRARRAAIRTNKLFCRNTGHHAAYKVGIELLCLKT